MTREAIASLRLAAVAGLPQPLVDSPKCTNYPLARICPMKSLISAKASRRARLIPPPIQPFRSTCRSRALAAVRRARCRPALQAVVAQPSRKERQLTAPPRVFHERCGNLRLAFRPIQNASGL